jgi:hypothetical protein
VPGISVEMLENCLHQAFFWANNLGREKDNEGAAPDAARATPAP